MTQRRHQWEHSIVTLREEKPTSEIDASLDNIGGTLIVSRKLLTR